MESRHKRINPFAADVHPDGIAAVADLHRPVLDELVRGVRESMYRPASGGGSVFLLSAPRAGYGKSHLLARMAAEMEGEAVVADLPVGWDGTQVWREVFWRILEAAHRPVSSRDPVTGLDLVIRRLFAMVSRGLIRSGKVPCARPEETLERLETNYRELFDFGDAGQPVAAWFAENFEQILPWAVEVVEEETKVPAASGMHWLRMFCGYAQGAGEGERSRMETLRWALTQSQEPQADVGGMMFTVQRTPGEPEYRERTVEFCRLASACQPLVLVADHLDSLADCRATLMRVATVIAELRRSAGRTVVMLSMNDDLWTQAMRPVLNSALDDRLTGRILRLRGIDRAGGEALLRCRMSEAGYEREEIDRFLHAVDLGACFSVDGGGSISPRTVLRYAARRWTEHEAGRREPVRPAAPAGTPFPDPLASGYPVRDADPPRSSLSNDSPRRANGLTVGDWGSWPDWPEDHSVPPPPATVSGTAAAGAGPVISEFHAPILQPPGPAYRPAGFPASVILPAARPVQPRVLQRYHSARGNYTLNPWIALDHDRLFHLVTVCGERLAILRFSRLPLDGHPGMFAGMWTAPGGDVLFGSEPWADELYWSALIRTAQARAESRPGTRLVVFSVDGSPVDLTGFLRPDEIVHARSHYLDVQRFDHPELASLYAADDVLRDAERGELGAPVSEVFAALSPHIDFLWKRITRPLPAPAAAGTSGRATR